MANAPATIARSGRTSTQGHDDEQTSPLPVGSKNIATTSSCEADRVALALAEGRRAARLPILTNGQRESSQTTAAAIVPPATTSVVSTPSPSSPPPPISGPPSGKKISSVLSRSNATSAEPKEKDRDRERTGEKHADPGSGAGPSPVSNPAIDPLSQHIFMRTNTDHSIPQRLRNPAARPDSPGYIVDGVPRSNTELSTKLLSPTSDAFKEKSRKGASFLSRLSMRSSRRKTAGDGDSDSELGSEYRADGTNARVFSQVIAGPSAGGGYIPHHKEPPRYIRTKVHGKKTREFNRMFLAQELVGTQSPSNEDGTGNAGYEKMPALAVSVAGAGGRRATKSGGAIWATEFSKDGKYLAAAGRDHVVRIWAVISTPDERRAHEEEEEAHGGTGERLSAPVFRDRPVQEFRGHTGEVLDLSWSKNGFLLSSSMDKTVRLWHMSRQECLCTFKHKDIVTKLAFHPRDDRFFLAGSLDTMLRLWSIPDKAVAFSVQLQDLVTAVAFSPDGKTAIAGLLNGLCLFYETEGLKYQTQIHVRSSRGKNAKGSKITGIQTMAVLPVTFHTASPADPRKPGQAAAVALTRTPTNLSLSGATEVKVLISSNDSRIRIYNLRDKSLDVKFKGHDNVCSQISATFSDDGRYVICGSEDRKAFIWSVDGADDANESSKDKDKRPCEYFEAHGDIVTTAIFAPTISRILLSQSGDPVYDLCNPPPVTLRSLDESGTAASQARQTGPSDGDAPAEALAQALAQAQAQAQAQALPSKKAGESPAYIARSTHYDGNIIITTDDTGIIKVFRQDCAFLKRKHENWETGSTFSRKIGGGGYIGGGLRRSGSILTRNSAGSVPHSRRGSISQAPPPSGFSPLQLGVAGANSDRILSWRQGIENVGERRASGSVTGTRTPAGSERSMSPSKASRAAAATTATAASAATLASEARRQPYSHSTALYRNNGVTSFAAQANDHTLLEKLQRQANKNKEGKEKSGRKGKKEDEAGTLPTPSFSFHAADDDEDQLRLDPAGSSYSFWNLSRWRTLSSFRGGGGGGGGGGVSTQSQTNGHSRSISDASPLARYDSDTGGDNEQERDGQDGKEDDSKPRRRSLGATALVRVAEDDATNRHEILAPSALNSEPSDVMVDPGLPVPAIQVPVVEVENLLNPSGEHDTSPDRITQSRDDSIVSKLSSEFSIKASDEASVLACRRCGGRDFKARKVAGQPHMSCGRCGALVERDGSSQRLSLGHAA